MSEYLEEVFETVMTAREGLPAQQQEAANRDMTLYTVVLVTFSAICAFMCVPHGRALWCMVRAGLWAARRVCGALFSCSSVHLLPRCLYRRVCVRVRVSEGLGVHQIW
jgi:hypothetical protein